MSRATLAFAEADMDWTPLKAIIGEDELGNWMWMHRDIAPASGAVVHFYKNIWSRRYLPIDREGRVYRELHDGTPVVVPGCGGGTLLTPLMLTSATFGDGMPPTITLPDAARQPTREGDLHALVVILEDVLDEVLSWMAVANDFKTDRLDDDVAPQ